MEKMKRGIIVSGATGMIGVSLVSLLLNLGYYVTVLLRQKSIKPGSLDVENPNLNIVDCSLCDYSKLNLNKDGVKYEHFFHLAWAGTFGANRDNANLQTDNIRYTLDAVGLAYKTGCSSFVGLGSQAEYGPREDLIKVGDKVYPSSGYGIAKYAAGKLGAIYAKQLGIKFNWGRLFSAYGPYANQESLLPYFITCLKNKIAPKLGPCTQIWDFIFVDDVARILLLIAEKGKDGKIYNIASGDQRPLKQYLEEIKNIIDTKAKIEYGHQSCCSFSLKPDTSDLITDFNYKKMVDFKNGILKTMKLI